MKKTREILCFGLSPGILAAFQEQSPEGWRFFTPASDTPSSEDPELVLCPAGQEDRVPEALRCATPLLAFGRRPEKIQGLFRRLHKMLEEPSLFVADFKIGPYVFSAQEKTLMQENGEEIDLTDREVEILFYLARQKNRRVAKNDLLKNVWKYQESLDTHTLETHIYRLRQKMERDSDNPVLLVTEEGGYRLVLPLQA